MLPLLRLRSSRPATALRVAVVVLLAGLALVLVPTHGHAHPALVETVPGAGYAVTTPPDLVSVTFNEAVTPIGEALTLQLADGTPVPLDVTLSPDRTSLRGVPSDPLEAGSYEVTYDVVALDGDLIEGAFPFGVATPVQAGSTAGGLSQDDPDQVQPETAVPRTLLFLGLSLALGGLVGALLVRRSTGRDSPVEPLVTVGALSALAGAAVLLAQIASWEPSQLAQALTTSGPTQLLAGEVGLLAAAALTARRPARGAACAAALVGVVLLEGVRAHPGEAAGSLGVVLTVLHLGAAAVWVGALLHVVRVAIAWRGHSLAAWVAVGAYARLALVLLALVAGTGTLSALLLLPTLQDWTSTTYGQVLLAKLVLFALVLTAAVLARTRHRRAVDDGVQVLDRVRRPWVLSAAAKTEAALLAALVAVTAALTSATPPELASQTALLPAPTGAVVRVAERAEQVTVAVVASTGRIEARAYAPVLEGANDYDLQLALQRPDGAREDLELAECGQGCWTADVTWGDGLNRLLADVDAVGWTGGDATLTVPWPPKPAAELIQSVQSVMGAQTAIRATETVTSGFGNRLSSASVRTGQEFLADEPWADGGVTDPVEHVSATGERVLVFALPVLGYHFQFTLDDRSRVVSARIVTGKHLLRREYSYPAQ
jgi:copper transport protein